MPCPEIIPSPWQWHPPIGVFIAMLAVLGVLVPWFRGSEIHRVEKAFWTVLMFALVGLEIRSIYLDQTQHDKEQALARCQQLQSFKEIGDGIKAAITNSQIQFDATMRKAEKILDTTQAVSKLANQNLENLTGGKSFAYVVPQTFAANENEIPLMIWNKGKNALTGVSVKFIDLDNNFATPDHIAEIKDTPVEEVGTLHSGEGKMMRFIPKPKPNAKGVNGFWIWIYSQNFTVRETLEFRKGKWVLPWAYRFSVEKEEQRICPPSSSKIPTTCMANVLLYNRWEWTDDLGEGKSAK